MTPAHERLLQDMDEHIRSIGGFSYSAAYADQVMGNAKRVLSNLHTVPATYIRTRSDRICFFADKPVLFEYDAKTNERGGDFFVECLPVWHHVLAYRHFNLPTIYGFRWPNLEVQDIGIVLDEEFRHKVDGVFVYDRDAVADVTDFVVKNYQEWFPQAKLIQVWNRRGSGDPSIRICRNAIKDFPHWKDVMETLARDNT